MKYLNIGTLALVSSLWALGIINLTVGWWAWCVANKNSASFNFLVMFAASTVGFLLILLGVKLL